MIAEGMSWEESIAREKHLRQQARQLLFAANVLANERFSIETTQMLATAEAARKRAREGTCTKAPGCPVHQMDSCSKNLAEVAQ